MKGKGKGTHLSTPAHAQTAPLADPACLCLDLLEEFRHLLRRRGGGGRPGEEVPEGFLLLVGVGRVDRVREGFAEEEVGDEDAVLVGAVGVGEDVGTLDGLGGEAEDVVDD